MFRKKIKYFVQFLGVIVSAGTVDAQLADSLDERFSIHAQTTVIDQFKPSFSAPYTGRNSLVTDKENKTSITSSLYVGLRLWKGAGIFVDPEIAGGSGLSSALGIAAATNGETFRVGSAEPKLYLARLFYKQIIALSKDATYQASDFNQLGGKLPDEYLAFTVGKVSIADFFDDNKYSHDPRTQFMSWALMDNGAWDYPANTRGYTPSVVLEYVGKKHELRYGISLLPLTANGNDMNWDLSNSSAQSIEYTRKYAVNKKKGAIRLLAFYNTTHMGNYRQSISLNPQNPFIQSSEKYGNAKYGFGLNAEQDLNDYLGCFFRASWNDGNNETWAFTEIDQSMSAGFSSTGKKWKRENDNVGVAYVISGISAAHRAYLKAGGTGFMLGDGNLNYAFEQLTEFYYSAELVKGHIYLSGAYQFLINPGYNKDRHGPVNVFSVRLHARI